MKFISLESQDREKASTVLKEIPWRLGCDSVAEGLPSMSKAIGLQQCKHIHTSQHTVHSGCPLQEQLLKEMGATGLVGTSLWAMPLFLEQWMSLWSLETCSFCSYK